MKYKLQQKLWAFGDDFLIQNELGVDSYFVDGKMLSFGDQLSFQDMQANELARIEQQMLTLGKRYKIYRGDQVFATVKKQFTLVHDLFDVEDPQAGDFKVYGDIRDHEYRFMRNGELIATVSKEYFAMSDTYGVDIVEGEDEILILACAVVIDMCSHDG